MSENKLSATMAIVLVAALAPASGLFAASPAAGSDGPPSPTVALAIGSPPPRFNVSAMRIESRGWNIKPCYEITEGGPHVIGMLATAVPGTVRGENLSAIYFLRPAEDCDEWLAIAWNSAEPWTAVHALKARFGISDLQDQLWEVPSALNGSVQAEKPYHQGFVANDPIGTFVNSFDEGSREVVIHSLKESGYPVADLAFERADSAINRGWLLNAAQFFDGTIGRELRGAALQTAVATQYRPPNLGLGYDPTCVLVAVCADLLVNWCMSCNHEVIYGEWQPEGDACECRTDGPWSAVCGQFTADASGTVQTFIPFPPPLGTLIEFHVGVGVTIGLCVCVWQRTCMAASVRPVTTTHHDCTRSLTLEHGPRMAFATYGWVTAFPAEQCQHAGRPPHIPPASQECGLRTPTPGS